MCALDLKAKKRALEFTGTLGKHLPAAMYLYLFMRLQGCWKKNCVWFQALHIGV